MSIQQLKKLISPKLNKTVILNMVKRYGLTKNIKITHINIQNNSQKRGDSYLSAIFKFTLNAEGVNRHGKFQTVSIPVFLKTMPPHRGHRETLRTQDFFENEGIFYDKVWPVILNYCDSKNVKNEFETVVPKALACFCDTDYDFIVLEDLSFHNYKSLNRMDGLDYISAVKVIEMFAKFHGASLAFKNEHPVQYLEIAKCLKETYFAKKFGPWYKKYQKMLFNVVFDSVKKELPNEYFLRIKTLLNDELFDTVCEYIAKQEGPLCIVTQGDAWVPNFLFKLDKNDKIIDIILTDFQISRYASACNDITFFLLTCVESKCLSEDWDNFLIVYHKELLKNLRKFGVLNQLFTLRDIQKETKKTAIFALAMTIDSLSMSLLDEFEAFTFGAAPQNEAVPIETVWAIQPFKDPKKRKRLAAAVKHILDRIM